jgi:hypothetical protein
VTEFNGIDIGQRRDPTAICVAELQSRPGPTRAEIHYLIRHLDRLPLRTPYPDVARRLRDLCSSVAHRSGESPTVYVDATGVGLPVLDIPKAAATNARVVGVFFTHGDRRDEKNGEVRLGKAFLVSRLQALLQTGRLHLPRTAEADALAAELRDYEIRVSEDANEKYGAFRVGTHDDLVTGLGLAVQVDHPGGGAYAWRARRPDRSAGRSAGSLRSDWIARLRG